MLHRITSTMLVTAAALAGSAASADWQLDAAASSFYYVTDKAAAVSEVNSFTGLAGGISDAGTATLTIDLATVDTAVEIRNQRMRDILFQVAQFPQASVKVTVDAEALRDMQAGMATTGSYPVEVSLHGAVVQMNADLQVLKLNADTLQVQLARPLIVAASAFGLAEGVEELRKIANLTSITPNVVVDFTLVYRQ